MNNLLFAIVFISPPFLKKLLLRLALNAYFGRGSRIGWFSAVVGKSIYMGDFAVVKTFTMIKCSGTVKIGKYSEISSFSLIYGSADFVIGKKCYLGPQSLINATEDVRLGNEVGIGARTMIYTHGSFLPYTEGYWAKFGKVLIGNRVWLAAGVFIHPGIQIGDNVFVNSRSVVTENIPSGKVMDGFPAREVVIMDKVCRNVSPRKKDLLITQVIKHFASYFTQTEKNVQLEKNSTDDIIIKWKGNSYRVYLVGTKQEINNIAALKHVEKTIYIINNKDFSVTFRENIMYFDFFIMKASYSKNEFFQKLYLFMKQYYGLFFEYDFNDTEFH